MALGIIVGGWFASAVISKLVNVGITYIEEHFKQQKGMKKELERLEKVLPYIQSVVQAADTAGQQQITDHPHLKAWLWQLKDALYEADDVLDELDYLQLKLQVESDAEKEHDHRKVRSFISNSRKNVIKPCKHVLKSDPTLDKLRGVVKRLDEVAAHVGNFLPLVSIMQQQHQQQQAQTALNRQTGPVLTENQVFGRDGEREELLQWLIRKPTDQDESNNNVSLYSVVGPGGMGKTTLAQLVYNDESVRSFDLKMWVCVSTSFDVRGLTAAILESATKERPRVDGLPALQDALKAKLSSSQKFLLVLDDVWNDNNRDDWDKLLAPLKFGHKESKILLTTRIDRVAEIAAQTVGGARESMKLERLQDDDFFPLFSRYAFAGVESGHYKKLQSIGTQIARKLGGSPLAAKTIGALLNDYLDVGHWTNILHSSISDHMHSRESNIMSILILSYHHLAAQLRPCFAYCSIFPQDYQFVKEELVYMWIAVGLIQQSHKNQKETLEDVGGRYFGDLVKRSFFEPRVNYKKEECYVMHDLLHELAQSVSQDECFRVMGDMPVANIPNTVRHLWFETDNLNCLAEVDKWRNLCTLVLVSEKYDHAEHATIFKEVLKSLKSTRVLRLHVRKLEVFPDEVGELTHLRFLYGLWITEFPRSICKLYHLQVIESGVQTYDCVLPEGMNNLISLRRLKPSYTHKLIDRIGKLTFLQELDFCVKKNSGYRIEELKDHNQLRRLKIDGLDWVRSPKEASLAELHKKEHLLDLELTWNFYLPLDSHLVEEEILDRLWPYSIVSKLTISGYHGVRSANWMDHESINNLEYIELESCSEWECLPSLGKLPFLKQLRLRNMPSVKQIDCRGGFPQLEVLEIYRLHQLREWSGVERDTVQWCPLLQKLKIGYCIYLEVLPSLPLSLTKLELEYVGLSTLPSFWPGSCCNSKNDSALSSSFHLSSLSISKCSSLTSLASSLLQHHLTTLERLVINDCFYLVDLPAEGLHHLSSLKHLLIEKCPHLQLAPNMITSVVDKNFLPSSLQYMCIGDCGDLKLLIPNIATRLPSLETLIIEEAERWKSLDWVKALCHVDVSTFSSW